MRVAHVITRMIIGGAQENTLLNCQDLITEHGDEVLLICGPETGPEGDLLGRQQSSGQGRAGRTGSANVPVEIIDPLRRAIHPTRDWQASRRLARVLGEFAPDVVHTHSAKAGLLGRQVAWKQFLSSPDRRPAVIHTVHGAPFHEYQSARAKQFFIACERWAARRCHHLISVADAMTDRMVSAGVAPREKFTTISSGMNVEPFLAANEHRERVRHHYGIGQEQVVIGKIARLFHLKGHADLIGAARKVVDACPQARFLLVGDGVLREPLQAQIAELGLTDHFILTGLVPPSEVPAMIGAMDLLVHTSYREGLARALPQALIAGKPVVSYDIDGAREVVIDHETGYLVPPADHRMLADRLIELARNPELRFQQGRAGQLRFTDQFRHQTMTRNIRQLYRQLLAEQPTKRDTGQR
ncbi:glycosyltransferase family 4 protein [Allorhodopirellula solitaria]|uniref:2-deoxystreptamine glucosyltransferase n=1 Tax=Allorhodopirellula solitaria TaxID=2527987 RepID=A0A5C5YB18_9BACT|nr:glycosyltransferase family 4 protein [Allorhodopirellula solitaria]TWT72897.1 2-deoxystreptamine glucosyltransferase [Allorhodopirellula solitaria]